MAPGVWHCLCFPGLCMHTLLLCWWRFDTDLCSGRLSSTSKASHSLSKSTVNNGNILLKHIVLRTALLLSRILVNHIEPTPLSSAAETRPHKCPRDSRTIAPIFSHCCGSFAPLAVRAKCKARRRVSQSASVVTQPRMACHVLYATGLSMQPEQKQPSAFQLKPYQDHALCRSTRN